MKRSLLEQDEIEKPQDKKVRQIEHVDGNWPSFIYILLPTEENEEKVENIISEMNQAFQLDDTNKIQALTVEKNGCRVFHISLSKLFFLRHFQIDSFVNSLRQSIKMKPFAITLSGSQLFTNEDHSRSFCSILVQKGFNNVVQLIKQIDTFLVKYKKECYYSPPIPHCTIGSSVGDLSEKARQKHIYGNEYVEEDDYDSDDENLIDLFVDRIHVCIGNQDFEIPLE